MKRWIFAIFIIIGLAALGLVAFFLIDLGALQDPGQLETILATRAKRLLIRRSSRDGIPPAPADLAVSIEEGGKLFGTDCAQCHGLDGNTPTDAGRWMYPRAPKLSSPEIQQYSDRDFFWIIKNGIRLSGMPAFGKVESDQHIWNLAHYTRSLRAGEQ
jgi:mono/diheme cytochrome c family protein